MPGMETSRAAQASPASAASGRSARSDAAAIPPRPAQMAEEARRPHARHELPLQARHERHRVARLRVGRAQRRGARPTPNAESAGPWSGSTVVCPPSTGTRYRRAPARRPSSTSRAVSAVPHTMVSRSARGRAPVAARSFSTVTTAATPAARGLAATKGGQIASAASTRCESPMPSSAASSPSPPMVSATAARASFATRPGWARTRAAISWRSTR